MCSRHRLVTNFSYTERIGKRRASVKQRLFAFVAELCAAIATASCTTVSTHAPGCSRDEATFVRRHGDTILAVETTRWSHDSLVGVVSIPSERARFAYELPVSVRGQSTDSVGWRLHLRVWRDGHGAPDTPVQSSVLVLNRGMARLVVEGDLGEQVQLDPAPVDAVPAYQMSHGLLELLFRIARNREVDGDIEQAVFYPGSRGWSPVARIRFVSSDSALLVIDDLRLRAHVDQAGRLLGAVFVRDTLDSVPVVIVRHSCDGRSIDGR